MGVYPTSQHVICGLGEVSLRLCGILWDQRLRAVRSLCNQNRSSIGATKSYLFLVHVGLGQGWPFVWDEEHFIPVHVMKSWLFFCFMTVLHIYWEEEKSTLHIWCKTLFITEDVYLLWRCIKNHSNDTNVLYSRRSDKGNAWADVIAKIDPE